MATVAVRWHVVPQMSSILDLVVVVLRRRRGLAVSFVRRPLLKGGGVEREVHVHQASSAGCLVLEGVEGRVRYEQE